MKYRPEGWKCEYLGKKANKYYELGADAMLGALFKLAKESPTGTFEIDSKVQQFTSRVFIPEES